MRRSLQKKVTAGAVAGSAVFRTVQDPFLGAPRRVLFTASSVAMAAQQGADAPAHTNDRQIPNPIAAHLEAQAAAVVALIQAGSTMPTNFLTSQLRNGRRMEELYVPTELPRSNPRPPPQHAAPRTEDDQGQSGGRGRYFARVVPGESSSSLLEEALKEARGQKQAAQPPEVRNWEEAARREEAARHITQEATARSLRLDSASSRHQAAKGLNEAEQRELHARIDELNALDSRLHKSLGELSLSRTLSTEGRDLEGLAVAARSPSGSFKKAGGSHEGGSMGGSQAGSQGGSFKRDHDAPDVSSMVRPSDVESFADLRHEEQRWHEEELAYNPRSRSWLLPPGTSLKSLFLITEQTEDRQHGLRRDA